MKTYLFQPETRSGVALAAQHPQHAAAEFRQIIRFAAGDKVPVHDQRRILPEGAGIDQIILDAR